MVCFFIKFGRFIRGSLLRDCPFFMKQNPRHRCQFSTKFPNLLKTLADFWLFAEIAGRNAIHQLRHLIAGIDSAGLFQYILPLCVTHKGKAFHCGHIPCKRHAKSKWYIVVVFVCHNNHLTISIPEARRIQSGKFWTQATKKAIAFKDI